jgi:DNA-binding MarR family transcriptional regulator/GNAT superfamily N-acetyltransferase
MTDIVAELRAFNRFYTRRIGLLNEQPYGGGFTLTEVRVLFELAHAPALKPGDLVAWLGLDPGYVSRILKRFEANGLITRTRDPEDGRGFLIRLTEVGRAAFEPVNQASIKGLSAMIAHLSANQRQAVGAAARTLTDLLGASAMAPIDLRPLQIGDIGTITRRQGRLYAEEYGWDITYEALVAELLSGFVNGFDPAKEDAFIADRGGEVMGSVFLFRGETPDTAKLRLLYVDPAARGQGLGVRLVNACIDAARARGYARIRLWTQDCLVSARRIYQGAGFDLVSEERHHRFGHDLNAQIWERCLTMPP